jgi:hypothetical protein
MWAVCGNELCREGGMRIAGEGNEKAGNGNELCGEKGMRKAEQ